MLANIICEYEYKQFIQGIQSDMGYLDLSQSIDLIQTFKLLYQSRFLLYLKIICPFDEIISTNLVTCLKDLSLLKGLDVTFIYPTSAADRILSLFFQNLHYLENLEYFSLKINFQKVSSFYQNLAEKLKSIQRLKYLNLDVYVSYFTVEEAKQIKLGIKCLKQLKSLSYSLDFNQNINDDKVLAQLCKGFKKLNSLEHLSLNIKQVGKITQEFLQSISQSLTNLQNLNSLHLKFMQTQIFSQEGLISLKDSLLTLKGLSKLLIVMYDFHTDCSYLISLVNGVLSIDNLTELVINMQSYCLQQSQITLGQSINKNSQLQRLHINLSIEFEENINTHTVQLDQNFSNLKKLTEFYFFMNIRLVDIIEQGLFKLLQNCLSIQVLQIDCKINISSQIKIEKYVENLNCLKQLSLQIYQENNILDIKYLESLKSSAGLQKLEYLQLFVDDNIIQTQSTQMKEYLQQLISLKSLTIQDLSLISEKNFFNSIGDSFYFMKNLQRLDLNIQQNQQNRYFESLSESFKFLENLRYLSFSYYNDVNILLFKSWKQIALGIKMLRNLSEFAICFQFHFDNKDDPIELFEALSYSQYLNIIQLYFIDINDNDDLIQQWQNITKRKNKRLVQIIS